VAGRVKQGGDGAVGDVNLPGLQHRFCAIPSAAYG
jgi:hypothetical protein